MAKTRGRFLLAAGAGIAAAFLAGCLTDPDSGPSYRSIDVELLRFETPIAPHGNADSIDVEFLVGTNGCWYLEKISLEVDGSEIVVSGTAKSDAPPDGVCPTVVVYGERRLALPPLDAGVYVIRACRLVDTLVVVEGNEPPRPRMVLKGNPSDEGGEGCAALHAGERTVGLSNLPGSAPEGALLIWADEIAVDPCGRGASYDFFASVRRVSAYSP
ncbi:MAG: hypothetical protein ABIK65_11575 [Candidatus Eisenbacteria bacterium]